MLKCLTRNKRNLLTTLVSASLVFLMVFGISSYFFTKHHFELFEREKASIAGDTAEMLYLQERKILKDIEPKLDDFMSFSLKEAEKRIDKLDEVNRDDLLRITQELGVTGAWLIEGDEWVRISTDGMDRDTRERYWASNERSWEEVFQELLNHPGREWINGFTKVEIYDSYPYYKLGYRGIGEVEGLGPVVLELGLSIKDIREEEDELKTQFHLSDLNDNITDITFVRNNPFKNPSFYEGQKRIDNETLKEYVVVDDFNGDETQIIITAQFPFLENLKRILLVVTMLGLFVSVIVGGVIIYFIRKK